MRTKKKHTVLVTMASAMLLLFLISGCGGGGGGQAGISGHGKVAAVVKLTGRTAGRTAAVASGTVSVDIVITGIYSETGSAFTPVETSVVIDIEDGYGEAPVTGVPIGINHLLTAIASWPSGFEETVKVIIPAVNENETTTITADRESTVVAETAVYYAAQHGITLSELTSSVKSQIEAAVASLSATLDYSQMTPQIVLSHINSMSLASDMAITPTSATISFGGTQLFEAEVSDADGNALMDVSIAWSVSPAELGTINSGMFTSAATGTGVITAAFDLLTATASITVVEGYACTTDADCDDGDALTLDACANGGTSSAACTSTAIACNTDADCDTAAPLCVGGGTTTALCVACNTDADCDDGDALTLDACANGGTSSAACTSTAIACNTDADCDTAAPLCVGGGTTTALCVACNTDADCDDGDTYTLDACANGGIASAACSNTTMACIADTDCNDSSVFTTDTCANVGTANAACSFDPIACTLDSECPDDGVSTTASECVNLVCAAVEISVMGTVTQGGVAVAGAVVRIYNDTYEDTTLTDATGAYYFTGVPSGTYYIIATKENATLESSTVTVP